MSTMLDAFIEAMLFASTDENGDPLDRNYSIDDIDESTLEKLENELERFQDMATKKGIDLDTYDSAQVGHDLFLTREGHGTGFWDSSRPYSKKHGKILTDICKELGEVSPYVGDDNKIYTYGS